MKKNHGNPHQAQGQPDIGRLLADERQRKKISVKLVAKATNLSQTVIESLERNDFSGIGANLYVRGYLGLYARYLGLDTAQVIAQYDAEHPAEPVAIRPALSQSLDKKRERHSKTLSLAVALAVFAILVYGYCRLEPLFFTPKPAVITTVEGAPEDSAIVENARETKKEVDDVLEGLPSEDKRNALVSNVVLESIGADEPPTVPKTEPLLTQSVPEVVQHTENSVSEVSVETAPSPPKASLEVDKKSDKAKRESLKMSFTKDCWIKITDKKGKTVISGVYKSNRPIDIEVAFPITVTTVRPEAIRNFFVKNQRVEISHYRIGKHRFKIKL